MVQKINPHPATGCNRSPPTMYFQKIQFLGVFRPFLQRSLPYITHGHGFSKTSQLFSYIQNSVRTWSDFTCSPDHCLVVKELKLKIRVTEKCQLLCQSTCLLNAVPPFSAALWLAFSNFVQKLRGISTKILASFYHFPPNFLKLLSSIKTKRVILQIYQIPLRWLKVRILNWGIPLA